ncbi:MAG: DUF6988 family protein [Pseudomarimonas sp.]
MHCTCRDTQQMQSRVQHTFGMTDVSLHARSELFEYTLAEDLGAAWWATHPIDQRHRASVTAARLSTEHARAARLLLLKAMAPQSGAALLRLQFEKLLRAVWVLYRASDDQVGKLSAPLTEEAEQRAKNLPGPLYMLTRVVECTPVGLHDALAQFHRSSWRALNSFVHTGIHPLARASGGFPVALAEQLTYLSNGLVHVAYRLQASFLGQTYLDTVTRVWPAFRDALPPIVLPSDNSCWGTVESHTSYPR